MNCSRVHRYTFISCEFVESLTRVNEEASLIKEMERCSSLRDSAFCMNFFSINKTTNRQSSHLNYITRDSQSKTHARLYTSTALLQMKTNLLLTKTSVIDHLVIIAGTNGNCWGLAPLKSLYTVRIYIH